MKNVLMGVALLFLLTSCGSTINFPISSVIPSAVITAKVKQDKSNNYSIFVKAENLASADRLSPPKAVYIVWIATSSNGIKNIGQLKSKNAKTATLETVSSFGPTEIIITAENQSDISYPSGTEISRVAVK
ncbi:MAG: hypothetical protein IPH84_14725 [Bacteroidales bacterium]|nr:hypothetical protein [Bacteroidales bacterium]